MYYNRFLPPPPYGYGCGYGYGYGCGYPYNHYPPYSSLTYMFNPYYIGPSYSYPPPITPLQLAYSANYY